MSITIDILKGMKAEDIEVLEFNLLDRLNELDDIKVDYELYYDLDDEINLECYHEAIREMDKLYERLTVINRYYYNEGECC
jgi:hypothetical protein